jgi:Tfp pilus assembly protein PilN
MSNINLLPWREERIFYKNNVFFLCCAIVAVVSVVVMLFVNGYVELLINAQHGNIELLNKEISFYQEKIKEINGLKERKEMALSRAEIINSLQAKRSYLIRILEGLVRSAPDGLVFNQIDMKDTTLLITGECESNSRVSLFMRNLEGLKYFSNPALQEIKAPQSAAEHVVSFVLQVKVLW